MIVSSCAKPIDIGGRLQARALALFLSSTVPLLDCNASRNSDRHLRPVPIWDCRSLSVTYLISEFCISLRVLRGLQTQRDWSQEWDLSSSMDAPGNPCSVNLSCQLTTSYLMESLLISDLARFMRCRWAVTPGSADGCRWSIPAWRKR